MTLALPSTARWYIRGPSTPPTSSNDWHIEGPSVDAMLCGISISVDDGTVTTRDVRNVCPKCERAVRKQEREARRAGR